MPPLKKSMPLPAKKFYLSSFRYLGLVESHEHKK